MVSAEVELLAEPHSFGAKFGLLLYGSLPLSLNEMAILFVCYVYKVSPLNSYRLDPPRQSGPRFRTSPSIFDVSAPRIRVAESLFLRVSDINWCVDMQVTYIGPLRARIESPQSVVVCLGVAALCARTRQ